MTPLGARVLLLDAARADIGRLAPAVRPGGGLLDFHVRLTPEVFDAVDVFADRFILEGRPRRGGSALVWKARDIENDYALTALKVFDAGARASPLEAKFFSSEVEALSQLEHPNIVRLLAWDTKPQYYVALEWLDQDLWDKLVGSPYTDWDAFWSEMGEPILEALAWAYKTERIIHRDVSPGNVLIGADGTPKLTDFGSAKFTARQSPVRQLSVGDQMTEPFALRSDDPSGPHVATRDVYGFAAVAVFCLTSTRPFGKSEDVDAAFAGLPLRPEIREVLERCLSQDEAKRPESSEALLAELRALQQRGAEADEASRVVFIDLGRAPERAVKLFRADSADEVHRMIAADLRAGIAFAPYVSSGREVPGMLRGYGTEYAYQLKADDAGGGYLVLVGVSRPPPEVLERLRDESFAPLTDVRLSRPQATERARRAVDELLRDVADHEAERVASLASSDLHGVLARWQAVLELRENAQRQLRQGVPYAGRRAERGSVLLAFSGPTTLPAAGEAVVLCDASGQRVLAGEVIDVGESSLLVARTRGAEPADAPSSGFVRIDTWAAEASLKRQRDALRATEQRSSLRRDLGSLLSNPGESRAPVLPSLPGETWDGLDPAQADALGKAVGAPDFVAVEGPPGTGKTTFIARLVGCVLAADPQAQILIASQTNVAVDHALERIAAAHSDEIRIVRIGAQDGAKVSARAREWLVGEQLRKWRRDVVDRSRAYVDAEARRQGLDVGSVELAVDLEELADVLDRAGIVRARLAALEQRASSTVESMTDAVPADDLGRETTARRLTTGVGDQASVNDEMEGLHEELDRLGADRRALLDSISSRAHPPAQRTLERAQASAIRGFAVEAMAAAGSGAEALKHKLGLHAEWIQRFGHGAAFEAAALRRAQIVGATCVGLAGSPGYPSLEFDVCILDEASRATSTEALVPLVRARRWVVVGDLQQLPPFVEDTIRDRAALSDMGIRVEDLTETAFARLLELLPPSCTAALNTQYRMHPAIGTLISRCFYEDRLVNGRKAEPALVAPILPKPVAWLSTSGSEERREARRGSSWVNDAEASAIRALLSQMNFLLRAGRDEPPQVGVLSGYLAQCSHIESMIARDRAEWSSLDVEVGTVDAVQGREFDVVLYSVTRSNPHGTVGFLRDARRMNVALSRAKRQLVIVGDHEFCRDAREHPLRVVLEHVERHPDDCCLMGVS